jgi:hypothetical protein
MFRTKRALELAAVTLAAAAAMAVPAQADDDFGSIDDVGSFMDESGYVEDMPFCAEDWGFVEEDCEAPAGDVAVADD